MRRRWPALASRLQVLRFIAVLIAVIFAVVDTISVIILAITAVAIPLLLLFLYLLILMLHLPLTILF
jgi:hypothetical protein